MFFARMLPEFMAPFHQLLQSARCQLERIELDCFVEIG
jgi:hypothetical protein